MVKKIFILLSTITLLSGCNLTASKSVSSEVTSSLTSSSEELEDLEIRAVTITRIYENKEIDIINKLDNETFTYSYNGDAIRIEDNKVIGLRGNTKTTVTVTSSLGRTGAFNATVRNTEYKSTHSSAESSEGWFNEVNIDKISSMTSTFVNGMDISSMKQLYDNGARFYDKNGNETALPLLLKDNGVNYIRLRLWVEPYDTWTENGETKTFAYGGGNCTTENVLWMAKECKAVGLKVLLNFHYSDYWTDPSNQIIPKKWKDITSVETLSNEVYKYTKETLELFKSNNALPDSVALGNEIYNGIFAHNPGTKITKEATGDAPYYHSDRTERTNGTQAKYDHTDSKTSLNNSNLRTYLKAGIRACREVDSSIQIMVHFVRGLSAYNDTIKFFNVLSDLDIDIYAVSAYSYYHFSNISTLRSGMQKISQAFPNKKIAIAETSYGFTFETDALAVNTFTPSGTCSPVSGYPASVQGQASMIRDTTEVVSNLSNGWGVFYWEGAWTPVKNSGWADAASKASWANQALVSYNGKALASLEVYNKMKGI